MKRSPMPPRKTPMRRTGWRWPSISRKDSEAARREFPCKIESVTGKGPTLKMRKTLIRKTRLSPIGKNSKSFIPPAVKAALKVRSGGRCERVIGRWRCANEAMDPHHVLAKSQGGKHTLENLLHLCRRCHNFCKDEPKRAEAEGLIRKWNYTQDAHDIKQARTT